MVMDNEENMYIDHKRPLKLKPMHKKSKDEIEENEDDEDNKKGGRLNFCAFLRDRWKGTDIDDEITNNSEMSVYSSTSEFLYQQQVGYASYFGLQTKKSNTNYTLQYSVSESAEEHYIL